MQTPLSGGQFSSQTPALIPSASSPLVSSPTSSAPTPTPSAGPAPTPNSSGPSVLPSAFSTAGNVVKATTGVTDFSQAKQSFSKGNVLGGIGHSIMGAINAGSTAAMVFPFVGEGVKAADIGLNLAVKGGDMFKAADTVKAVDTAKTTHLNPSQFTHDIPQLYHGTNKTFKPGDIIKPTSGAISTPENEQAYAWASKTPITSHKYAQGAAMAGSKTEKGWTQPSMWGAVYKVKPIDSSEVASSTNKFANASSQSRNAVASGLHFVSKKGFQVEGLSHLAENPELTRPNPVKISNIKPKTPQPPTPKLSDAEFFAKYGRESGI